MAAVITRLNRSRFEQLFADSIIFSTGYAFPAGKRPKDLVSPINWVFHYDDYICPLYVIAGKHGAEHMVSFQRRLPDGRPADPRLAVFFKLDGLIAAAADKKSMFSMFADRGLVHHTGLSLLQVYLDCTKILHIAPPP